MANEGNRSDPLSDKDFDARIQRFADELRRWIDEAPEEDDEEVIQRGGAEILRKLEERYGIKPDDPFPGWPLLEDLDDAE